MTLLEKLIAVLIVVDIIAITRNMVMDIWFTRFKQEWREEFNRWKGANYDLSARYDVAEATFYRAVADFAEWRKQYDDAKPKAD